jgi:hypothetical protein
VISQVISQVISLAIAGRSCDGGRVLVKHFTRPGG